MDDIEVFVDATNCNGGGGQENYRACGKAPRNEAGRVARAGQVAWYHKPGRFVVLLQAAQMAVQSRHKQWREEGECGSRSGKSEAEAEAEAEGKGEGEGGSASTEETKETAYCERVIHALVRGRAAQSCHVGNQRSVTSDM